MQYVYYKKKLENIGKVKEQYYHSKVAQVSCNNL